MSRHIRLVTGMLGSLAAAGAVLLCVATGITDSLDTTLFQAAHGLNSESPRLHPAWIGEAVRDVTALGSTTVLTGAVLIVSAYLLALKHYRLAILLASSASLATLVSTLLKLAMDRARPSLIEHAVTTYTASFPSGHALLTAAIILPMVSLLARTVIVPSARMVLVASGVIITVIVGLSRVYLGVHWPTDIVAGWFFGAFWACGTLLVARALR